MTANFELFFFFVSPRNQCGQGGCFDGQCNVAPLVPSWFEREGRAKQTVHITAALSGSKFLLMSLSSLVKLF